MNAAPIPQPRSGTDPPPLRDYQQDAITAVERAWETGRQRIGIVLPTGAGKTKTFSHLIGQRGDRALVLAHREELIDQAAHTLRAHCPGRSVGIVKAEHDFPRADIVVASVQTLAREHRRTAIGAVDLVVVDEAHHAVADTYRRILEHFGCYRTGGPKALGVTATMARSDDTESLGDVWEEIAYQLDILDLIDAGHLCDVRGISVALPGLNLDGVRTTGGDYQAGALAERMTDAEAWTAAADAYITHAGDRPGVVFTPTVAAAHQTAQMLTERGIAAEALDGTTPTGQRHALLQRFRSGDTQVVVNCGVLTEGFDAPWVAAILIARPTKSDVLYVQMAGRGLRTHPSKTDTLIIDLVGVTSRKKLATLACLTGRDVGEIPEGESLAEAHERHHTTSRTEDQTPLYLGELSATEIELFQRDRGAVWPDWNGVRYIDLGKHDRTVYITPTPDRPGRYDVIGRRRKEHKELVLASDLTFRQALFHAEGVARRGGSQLIQRGARWRDRPASDAQRRTLEGMRAPLPEQLGAGEASELISATIVARDFQRYPPRGYQPAGPP